MQKQLNHIEVHLIQFVNLLRHLGVRVSAAEVIDAMKALVHVDLLNRAMVKRALGATLIKTKDGQRVFEQAFRSYFATPEAKMERLKNWQEIKAVEEDQIAEAEADLVFMEEQEETAKDGDAYRLNLSKEQKRTYAQIPPEARDKLREYLKNHLEGNDINNPRNLLESVVRGQLEYWKRRLAQEQQTHGSGHAVEPELTGDMEFDALLEDILANIEEDDTILHEDMKNIADQDLDKVGVVIHKLSRQLATKISRRYRQSLKKQMVDIRRTVRYNIRYGGTMLMLKHRTRRIERPKILLLCDVSGSMSRYVRFVLQFIYGLSSAVAKIESFVFSEDIERISQHFRRPRAFEETMAEIMNHSEQWGRGTNLGAALENLWSGHGKKLSSETIVIIVSDGKTMGVERAVSNLKKLKNRCKDVLWLNTLPKKEWSNVKGLKEMKRYARVFECYTLAHLEKILRGHLSIG